MISFTVKPEAKTSVASSQSTKTEEPTLSFSELLKGVRNTKESPKVQNGTQATEPKEAPLKAALKNTHTMGIKEIQTKEIPKSATKESALSESLKGKSTTSTKETLSSLLKGEEKQVATNAKDALELNPKFTQNISLSELKIVIKDAKEYLKDKITQSDGYKRAQIKELPTTLKGLAEVAKKFDIDISKISIQEIQAKKTSATEDSSKIQTLLSQGAKSEATKQEIAQKIAKNASQIEEKIQEIPKNADKKLELKTSEVSIKETPLFKAQERLEHTTEQLVHSKQLKVDEKSPKQKADEALKLLLRGEKPSHSPLTHTPEISLATAKIITSPIPVDGARSLEQLLRGEESTSTSPSKLDGLTTHKAESLEVKLNEAKQMIRYLSSDVKSAIEDYKSPFTRVKVQLNPQKLGEVDLTIVQRGNNLHVNISSNNAAINTLVLNATELRTQLSNNGIHNASLNFSNNSQGDNSGAFSGGQGQSQGQNRENEQKAHHEYNYFGEEANNEEILSSLEIVVANYA